MRWEVSRMQLTHPDVCCLKEVIVWVRTAARVAKGSHRGEQKAKVMRLLRKEWWKLEGGNLEEEEGETKR